jgi:hypothetical protein
VNKTPGMILTALGLGLALGGYTYTTRERVADIGPILPPPIAGAVALIGGVVLLAAGKKC